MLDIVTSAAYRSGMDTIPVDDVAALARVGDRLRAWRRFMGYSGTELAKRLGEEGGPSTRQAIYQWEAGTSRPSSEKLAAACRALGVTVAELLGPTPLERAMAEREARQAAGA